MNTRNFSRKNQKLVTTFYSKVTPIFDATKLPNMDVLESPEATALLFYLTQDYDKLSQFDPAMLIEKEWFSDEDEDILEDARKKVLKYGKRDPNIKISELFNLGDSYWKKYKDFEVRFGTPDDDSIMIFRELENGTWSYGRLDKNLKVIGYITYRNPGVVEPKNSNYSRVGNRIYSKYMNHLDIQDEKKDLITIPSGKARDLKTQILKLEGELFDMDEKLTDYKEHLSLSKDRLKRIPNDRNAKLAIEDGTQAINELKSDIEKSDKKLVDLKEEFRKCMVEEYRNVKA